MSTDPSAAELPASDGPSTADFDLEELLACARYGELDELRALVASHPAPPASLLALSSPSLHGGSAALHMACANGHVPVVRYLVEVLPKAALDARNEGGNTALHWASLNGHLEAVEALLKAGANPKVLNNARRDPLYEAESMGLEAVATLLVQYGAANDEGDATAGGVKESEEDAADEDVAEGDVAMAEAGPANGKP